ncbi:MAG: fatty acid desaturase, partial [Myxococcales bacterium]|nr:fatty acid desaturase [Myxococcales bacterium]
MSDAVVAHEPEEVPDDSPAPAPAGRAPSAKAEERRAGAALVKRTFPFAEEDVGTTWRLFAMTVAVWTTFQVGALFHPWWAVQLLCAVLLGLTTVRVFIFFHDYAHGAIWRESKLAHGIMTVFGLYVLSPLPVWTQTHDYHHRNNAKMLGASIGSYPTVTVAMWHQMNETQRRWYKFARHPLTMLFGYLPVFMGGMCMAAFLREPKVHWQGPLAIALHFANAALVGWLLGPWAALVGVVLPLFVACAAGAYLFFAQHNFPSAELRGRDTWTYHHAALKASSMFDMPLVMHWFTGNIGYHHVHHL